jgi:hypothetical protein
MVEGYTHLEHGPQPSLARSLINQRIGRIIRMFKWAVENELAPVALYQALTTFAVFNVDDPRPGKQSQSRPWLWPWWRKRCLT